MSNKQRFEIDCCSDYYEILKEYQIALNKAGRLPRHKALYGKPVVYKVEPECYRDTFYGEHPCPVIYDKRSFSGTIQEHMRILEMEAFYLMYKLNISSILIEFKPCEKDGDSTNPVELTLEPFGNSKRLGLIKRCLGRKKK